jgi:hypothetical protein
MDYKVGDEVGVIDDKGRVRGPYTILGRPTEHNNRGLWQHQWLLSNYLPVYESMLILWQPGISKDGGPITPAKSRKEIEELTRKINREVRTLYENKTGQSGEAGTSPANIISKLTGTYKSGKKRGRNNNNNRISKKLNYGNKSRKTRRRRA